MNKRFSILAVTALLISSLSILISCGDDDPKPDPVMVASRIELVSGGSQTAMVEETLENAIEVLVKDQEGNAFEGASVSFGVTEGSVSVASATTNAAGKANVTWTLGTTEGTQTLSISGIGDPLNVTATASPKPAIGDFYEGGVIFYLDATGMHGLVCAVTDQSDGAEWGCPGTTTGADGEAIGTGAKNTENIIANCATAGTGADLCANLSLNGYNDWFLPSKDELKEMYINKTTIETTALANNGVTFATGGADDYYWSSTELSNNLAAILLDFEDGGQGNVGKNSLKYVRAIRAF